MSMSDEIHPDLAELIEEWGEDFGMDADRVVELIDRQYGLDLTSVDDDDAEEFVEAFEEGDADAVADVLERYDVDEAEVEKFREMVDPQGNSQAESDGTSAGSSGSGSRANGESAPSGGDSPSKQEVAQMIDQRMDGLADELVSKIGGAAGGGGGGAGGGQAPAKGGGGGPGGLDPQTQQILAQSLAKHFLGGAGGGQAAELGQEVQKEAMQSFIKDLRKPDLGDLLEAKLYEEVLDSDTTDDLMADMIPSKQGSGEDGGSGDMFESLMVEQPDRTEDLLERVENGDLTADEAIEQVGESGKGGEGES